MSKLVSYREAAEALSVSRRTLYRMIDAGQFTPVNIRPDAERPTWRIPAEEVERITDQRNQGQQ